MFRAQDLKRFSGRGNRFDAEPAALLKEHLSDLEQAGLIVDIENGEHAGDPAYA
jgi:hypothetical protein